MVNSVFSRRRFWLTLTASASTALVAPTAFATAAAQKITIYKDPNCGCCTGWVTHLRRAAFQTTVIEQADLMPLRRRLGVPDEVVSCHTAVVGGYFVEGHVPMVALRRLLAEKPAARGIAVPGMPVGSPGMEAPDGRIEPYQVLLIGHDGRTSVFSRHR
ncbi:MAG: DUF411 domain-containing protein [Caulobacter sp.]|nr:DUF411 domain-containing protein [Caulobacter sp.]